MDIASIPVFRAFLQSVQAAPSVVDAKTKRGAFRLPFMQFVSSSDQPSAGPRSAAAAAAASESSFACFARLRLVGGLSRCDDVLALRLTLGLVRRAGDVEGDLHRDFRVEPDRDLVHADRLDRLVEDDVLALDLVAGFDAACAMSRAATEP